MTPTSTTTVVRWVCLLFLLVSPLLVAAAGAPASLTIAAVRVTNVSDFAFAVSWLTDLPASGQVRYGTTPALGHSQDDDTGAGPYTHHVTLSGLIPATTYYFDVIADGQVDDNGGAHYQLTLPPTGGIQPGADYFWGYVYQADGITPAAGAIVYVTLEDGDGAGSPGSSAPLSALADAGGVWYVNLAFARTADYSAFFAYTASGSDLAHVEAQAGPMGYAAFAPALGDSYGPDGLRTPIILTFAPRVASGRQANDVTLTWQHNLLLVSYQVWRATTPYFSPDDPAASLLASGLPPTPNCTGNGGTIACIVAGDVGSGTSYFYVVRGITGVGLAVDSNQVGMFNFALTPGN
jgi:hypothetical protein